MPLRRGDLVFARGTTYHVILPPCLALPHPRSLAVTLTVSTEKGDQSLTQPEAGREKGLMEWSQTISLAIMDAAAGTQFRSETRHSGPLARQTVVAGHGS